MPTEPKQETGNRGEDVLWKIHQKDPGTLAEASHRAVAVRGALRK